MKRAISLITLLRKNFRNFIFHSQSRSYERKPRNRELSMNTAADREFIKKVKNRARNTSRIDRAKFSSGLQNFDSPRENA